MLTISRNPTLQPATPRHPFSRGLMLLNVHCFKILKTIATRWLSDSFRVHQIRFRLRPRPMQLCVCVCSSWFKGPSFCWEGQIREGGGLGDRKGSGVKGRETGGRPLTQIPESAPAAPRMYDTLSVNSCVRSCDQVLFQQFLACAESAPNCRASVVMQRVHQRRRIYIVRERREWVCGNCD